jgi:hypothetical protein
MKIPDIFMPEKNLESEIEGLLKEGKSLVQPKHDKFEIVKDNTYAKGIAELKKQGKKPFTFFENVKARIADYETNGKNAELFNTWLDSITGVAYKANSTKFKIILRSDKLENIKPDFDQSFMPVDYNAEHGIKLDSSKGKYNQSLTRKEAKNHEFWLAVMNGDKEKLVEYVNLWFDMTGKDKGMGVYLRDNTSQNELRKLALYVNYSGVYGDYGLHDYAHFVSGAQ